MPDDLANRLLARQDQLKAALAEAKAEGHPGTAGDVAEGQAWRPVLRNFLPWRYQVGTGFVVDSEGGKSEQQDIILYDRQYSPALLSSPDNEQAQYVPIESVYAVLEAKPLLNRPNVLMAMKKAASVRRLVRTLAPAIHTAHGQQQAAPHGPILAGIVASESEWAWGNLHDTLATALHDGVAEYGEEGRLSLGTAVAAGSFREHPPGYLHIAQQPIAMISFLMELLRQLEPIATAGRMDIEAYHAALGAWGDPM
ncbi:DUF6602 domain-containing protein [Euzebya pacifica]|uniref:DUF6602 domain-containing protein n=1 Tax=Euzebya pacifica TaxID=1608957 RepID=UPI000DF78081|nr:DUF6602 domain-containing protein [Euzebya pacifica]